MPRRLALSLLLGGLVVSAWVLFGPLWDSAEGENPLTRPPGPDFGAVLRLALPTLAVSALVGVLLLLPAREGRDADGNGDGAAHAPAPGGRGRPH
ncbi:hypothetical protein SGUI_0349 [Serinicoccus hydrothermalis]|uniref:Uncharacterized protein n=1 Tax=Serinicoccus hydrothermalis TaxID=1758689 RepID=A0A1B1N8M5_9MICO|nr:hypothetical protein [Serinicoccus hydrothermalis]ANS77745.1 hypothetical protein SGUI_0349 [Serinicoccus hydrothermalis]